MWFWEFLFYSFLGFLAEVIFARATHADQRNRKCFYLLPLCPVYGLGALLILRPARWLCPYPLLMAFWSGLSATVAEYGMSLFYEKLLRVSFWDYTHMPLNLKGRVCPLFSGFWCVLGLAAVYVFQPLAAPLFAALPGWLMAVAGILFIVDSLVTAALLRKTGSTDVLCWYRRLPVITLSKLKSNLEN